MTTLSPKDFKNKNNYYNFKRNYMESRQSLEASVKYLEIDNPELNKLDVTILIIQRQLEDVEFED